MLFIWFSASATKIKAKTNVLFLVIKKVFIYLHQIKPTHGDCAKTI